VMVQADANHESVTFTKVTPEAQASQPNSGSLQIALMQANIRSNDKIDNAIVSFTEGVHLEKFYFGNKAKLYIPKDGKDYAIAYAQDRAGEMPLCFKATENSEYTISVNPEGAEMSYLHLIDNMTGADVDLLQTPTYVFQAKTTDYPSRFRLVFSTNLDPLDNFAFITNGQLVVTGEGTLQVYDALGRQLFYKELSTLNSQLSTSIFSPGVYLLQLVGYDTIKTQKIIIY